MELLLMIYFFITEEGDMRPSSPKQSHRSNYNRAGASPVKRCYVCATTLITWRGRVLQDVDIGAVPGVTQVMHT